MTNVYLSAEDDAGNTANTGTPAAPRLPYLMATPRTEEIACSPSACTYLADGTGENNGSGDIPGDPPNQQTPGSNVFSGYAYPTMRADTWLALNNPDGANLWMGYSWPRSRHTRVGPAPVRA